MQPTKNRIETDPALHDAPRVNYKANSVWQDDEFTVTRAAIRAEFVSIVARALKRSPEVATRMLTHTRPGALVDICTREQIIDKSAKVKQ